MKIEPDFASAIDNLAINQTAILVNIVIQNDPLASYCLAAKDSHYDLRIPDYDVPMKAKPTGDEYARFAGALRKVLTVSHSDMKNMLDSEKAEKKRKPRRASASHASSEKD